MKRIILLILFLGIIPIACQKVEEYFTIQDLTCVVYQDDALTRIFGSGDTISGNTTFFKLNLTYDYTSYILPTQLFNFSTPLMAFDKRKPGFNGLKDKLKTIKLYSNNLFNGHNAGEDLKELFKWHDIQWDGQKKSIDSLVISLNKESIFIGDPNKYFFKIILNDKPIDNLEHIFYLDFIYENGDHQLINTTNVIYKK